MDASTSNAPESDASASYATTSPSVVPVAAIGASSGGLKALEDFFRSMPPESGIAFVVAMHLSPAHESQLSHILQGFTEMPVSQVKSAVTIAADHVYVIAPGQRLSLHSNRLDVARRARGAAHGVVDHLFRSVAEDRREHAVGIVLSGSGSDGTVGSRAIKQHGGVLLAQDPDDAEYASMPHSIIDTGLVDFILPAGDMPVRLLSLHGRPRRATGVPAPEPPEEDDQDLLKVVLKRLYTCTGHDFGHYKHTALRRHMARRMLLQNDGDLAAYARRLQEDDAEVQALFKSMLVRVTRFFRDPKAFQALERRVIPKLFEEKASAENGVSPAVRVWVPGCSTGEEVYSLAMLLNEYRDEAGLSVPIQILASDIDEGALSVARTGLYPDDVISSLSKTRCERFFQRREGSCQVKDEIRSQVVFASHDVTRDPPFARIDLLSCRNLLIYFDAAMQQHVLERCAYSLRSGGYLFLGTAESASRASKLFAPISKKFGLYQRSTADPTTPAHNYFPVTRAFTPSRRSGLKSGSSDEATTVSPALPADQDPSRDALILANQELQSLNEEMRSMMEELEVAKEELQSLNEELITLNQELQNKIEEHRAVNNDLHVLIESTHMATLFLDQHLHVVLYTPESTKLFSLLPVDIGRPLEHLSHRLRYADVLRDARIVLEKATEVQREVQDQDGNWYAMRALPYPTADGPSGGVVLTFADITAQKRVEQVSSDRFSLAFHAGPMAASIVDREDGLFVEVNSFFEKITGFDREAVVGQPAKRFGLFLEQENDPASDSALRNAAPEAVDARMRTRSGALHDLVVSTTPIEFDGRPCYLSLFYDVTERKRLEREILLVSEREQRRIGVDLHDGLGTHLTGVAMMARGLARDLRNGSPISPDEVDEIARLLSDGIEQARTLAQGLNPFLLEVRGLTVALRELASNLTSRTGIACSFDEDGSGPALSSEQSMHLFRITQEALANAVRHGSPNRIHISLSRTDQRYRLVIHDDGVGFDGMHGSGNGAASPGMGLSIMRHRAEMIGARLNVTSSPGKGTTVICAG